MRFGQAELGERFAQLGDDRFAISGVAGRELGPSNLQRGRTDIESERRPVGKSRFEGDRTDFRKRVQHAPAGAYECIDKQMRDSRLKLALIGAE